MPVDRLALKDATPASPAAYRRRLLELLETLDVDAVATVAHALFEAWQRRALVLIAGNGGSASTASHMANDLVKATRLVGGPPFRATSITDNVSLLTAYANDEGYDTVFAAQLEALFDSSDVLLVISASGNSPNLVVAARRAQELGGTVLALTGFEGGILAEIADHAVHIPTEAGEYGPVEDMHLILNHMITSRLHALMLGEATGPA